MISSRAMPSDIFQWYRVTIGIRGQFRSIISGHVRTISYIARNKKYNGNMSDRQPHVSSSSVEIEIIVNDYWNDEERQGKRRHHEAGPRQEGKYCIFFGKDDKLNTNSELKCVSFFHYLCFRVTNIHSRIQKSHLHCLGNMLAVLWIYIFLPIRYNHIWFSMIYTQGCSCVPPVPTACVCKCRLWGYNLLYHICRVTRISALGLIHGISERQQTLL